MWLFYFFAILQSSYKMDRIRFFKTEPPGSRNRNSVTEVLFDFTPATVQHLTHPNTVPIIPILLHELKQKVRIIFDKKSFRNFKKHFQQKKIQNYFQKHFPKTLGKNHNNFYFFFQKFVKV